jgi:hypothetical protein
LRFRRVAKQMFRSNRFGTLYHQWLWIGWSSHGNIVLAYYLLALLSPSGQQAYVRVLNCGTTPCTVPPGNLLTTAEAVEKQNMAVPTAQQNEEEVYEHVQCLPLHFTEPASSPWASNALLVKKKDGTWRFCVDFRKFNDLTRKEAYPLPRIDTCLESLGGSCYVSTLDLRDGYWQTELDPGDADNTAFITRSGQCRFTVLSMGLANAPSQFQRLMYLIISGMLWDSCSDSL